MIETGESKKPQARPGAVLRSLRAKRGWTLGDVSKRTGLPVSTLSKVENDKMSLTYDKLVIISEGLDIDIGQLFGGEVPIEDAGVRPLASGRRSIARRGDGSSIETANYSHLYPAFDVLNKRMVPIIADLKARSLEEFGDLIRHSGEEYAYVLDGSVEFHTELYAPLILEKGDSIYFDSTMGHAYIAVSQGLCRILSICSATHKLSDGELLSKL